MRYSRITLKSGAVRYRSRPTDPATGRRVNVEADTLEELRARLTRIQGVRQDLRWGGITRKQAAERLRPAVTGGALTVASVFARYERTVPEGSRKIVEGHWRRRLKELGSLSVDELTRERMALWERGLQARGFASTTIHGAYDALAGAMRLAIDAGMADGLPWGDVPRSSGGSGYRPEPPRPKVRGCAGTVDQLVALVLAARECDARAAVCCRYSGLAVRVLFLALTGLRQAEACGLSWSALEIDREPFLMRITCQARAQWHKRAGAGERPNEPTKTRKNRTQALHGNVVLALRAHRAELQRRGWYRHDGPAFPGDAGEWRTSGKLVKPERTRELVTLAGLGDAASWVTHSFRHSFATLEVVASGGDLRATQARTGHASIQQLEGYLHAAGGNLGRSAVPLLPLEMASHLPGLPSGVEIVRSVDVDPWGIQQIGAPPPIERADLKEARQWEASDAEKRRTLRAGSERSFRELAAEWLSGGGDGGQRGRPEEVSEAEKRAYCRAYMRAKRAKMGKEACQKAGQRSRIATEGAWRKALVEVQRKIEAATSGENLESKPGKPEEIRRLNA